MDAEIAVPGSEGRDRTIQITLEMADREIRKADSDLMEPYEGILKDLDRREKDVIPFVLDLSINSLELANPRDFVLDAFGRKDFL